MNIYFTNPLHLLFYEIKNGTRNPISNFLINRTIYSNFSLVDYAEEDKISFISEKKLKKIHKDAVDSGTTDRTFQNYVDSVLLDGQSVGWTTNRIKVKIGRFLKKILDENRTLWEEFIKNYYSNVKSEDELIEEIVNHYKAATKRIYDKDFDSKINFVSGEDIAYWYNESNYFEGKGSSLQESCMRFEKCEPFLQIYVNNPEICQLMIFKETPDKISLRALIWTLPDGRKYMDRIYSSKYADMTIFINHARKNNWLCFDLNSNGIKELYLPIKNIEYTHFPYMDTFKYYDKSTFILSKELYSRYTQIKLSSQEGGYESA